MYCEMDMKSVGMVKARDVICPDLKNAVWLSQLRLPEVGGRWPLQTPGKSQQGKQAWITSPRSEMRRKPDNAPRWYFAC